MSIWGNKKEVVLNEQETTAATVTAVKAGDAGEEYGVIASLLENRKRLEQSVATMEDAAHLERLAAIKEAKKELAANEAAIELVVLSNRHLLGKAGKRRMEGYQVWTHEVITSKMSNVATTEDIQKLMANFPGLLDVKLSNTTAKKLAQRAETRQVMETLGVVLEATEVVKLKAV